MADADASAGTIERTSSPQPPAGYELPADFDGTRRNVARGARAGRWRSGGVRYRRDAFVEERNAEGAAIVSQVSSSIDAREALDAWVARPRRGADDEALNELQRLMLDAKAAGLGDSAPSMRRAAALYDLLAQEAAAPDPASAAAAAEAGSGAAASCARKS